MKKIFIIILALATVLTSCKKHPGLVLIPGFSDLTPTMALDSLSIKAGGTIQVVFSIKNIGTKKTSGEIVFTVTNNSNTSGLSLTSNNNASVTIGPDPYVLSNVADWNITSSTNTLTFTSKPGVIIPAGGFKNVGVTIARATVPNQGSDGMFTHSIKIASGTGGGETPDSNNELPNSITKAPSIPDLTPVQLFSGLQIPAGGTIQEVIQIKNIGTGPTTGPIVFDLTNYTSLTGLSVTSNNNSSVTIGSNTYTLTNAADWVINSTSFSLTFTSKPGVTIPAGGSKLVGVTITRAAAPNQGSNGSASHTLTIAAGTGGGESPVTNNSAFEMIMKS